MTPPLPEALRAVLERAALRPLRQIASLQHEPGRMALLSLEAAGLYLDLTRSPVDRHDWSTLLAFARDSRLLERRQAMQAGETINVTEQRKVWHPLLRADAASLATWPGSAAQVQMRDHAWQGVQATLHQMRRFAGQVLGGGLISDVVHIGIGGSYLGPELALGALVGAHAPPGRPRVHFLANVDPLAWDRLAPALDAQKTLFIMASKTWTTQETSLNARAVRDWQQAQGLEPEQIAARWAGVTARPDLAMGAGLPAGQIFGFEDWVGGRYSLWSSIGLPIMLGAGIEAFDALLAGARAMDQHFFSAPPEHNAPVMLALLSLWHQWHLGSQTEVVVPYARGLARLPAFLQQLQMESNGKRVDIDGQPLPVNGSPVIWGEPGTDAQHSFFQSLHQGLQIQPIDFVLVAGQPDDERARALQANALAQIEALSLGRPGSDAHRDNPGNRPALVVVLPHLDARSLGALLALYEHKTAALGWLLNLNSFDQFGVELGKQMAGEFLPLLARNAGAPSSDLSPATRALLLRLRRAGGA